ncbi:MAG: class I SAM-dependent methyltransferase [Candidatus Magasanikbacteria bacterium]|nr:class I SAM-dependent methyltransferase [Candidatus Magasanikbacteria bacterium]MCA9391469.1 class I SAM-dependent methyltransferase [Candidatus Magasanikbacteria bacterium]USN52696.1 MAG: class I SAM-dependent methyltransferase [Candidatus Nomurabacteria bacterium]HPF95465.1 class I SAM-dependent methyltransferase [bacterium]
MNNHIAELYQKHHAENERFGFTLFEKERSAWLLSQFPKKEGLRILDLGCRDATLMRHYAPFASTLVGVDIDASAIAEAQKRLPQAELFQMDLLGDWSELQGHQFDIIACSEVLEHVYYPQRVAEKVSSLLAPGGVFIGTIPNAFFLKHRLRYLFALREGTPISDPTHITQFNLKELRRVLSVISNTITISGYTRLPFRWLAKKMPSVFAFDLYFSVKKNQN